MTTNVFTFGCRLNTYESQVIKDALLESKARDVAVFNTCAVTKEAERQARQAIRKYHRTHPKQKIIVTGCSAQITPHTYADMKEVDVVLGNEEKLHAKNYIDSFSGQEENIKVNDIMSVKETASHIIQGVEGHTRAFLQVQNGCNHRCTFCIIPFGRGNSRSVAIGEIVHQSQILVEHGYQEIVLTGVDLTDYGKDLPGTPTLGQMIRRLLNLVPNLRRLRLSSIDVAEIDDDLRDLIANESRLMPHIHLSLQSGDNMILKRMKRRHTREQVISFCQWAKNVRPNIVFGADIITGFPTETEAMFANTVNIVEEAGLTYLHVFPYSKREGTAAARIPDTKQIPAAVRKQRAAHLRQIGIAAEKTFLRQQIGRTLSAVIEKENMGRSEEFALVNISQNNMDIGKCVDVNITGTTDNYLLGTIANI